VRADRLLTGSPASRARVGWMPSRRVIAAAVRAALPKSRNVAVVCTPASVSRLGRGRLLFPGGRGQGTEARIARFWGRYIARRVEACCECEGRELPRLLRPAIGTEAPGNPKAARRAGIPVVREVAPWPRSLRATSFGVRTSSAITLATAAMTSKHS
jgi:hypothetical protein